MTAANLSDEQWCVLDLLMRAKQRGVNRINRHELLGSPSIPDMAKVKLVFAALTMPKEYVQMYGQHDFELTSAGEALHRSLFNKPTPMADSIIALPDRSHEVLQ
jgi:hypothetical protein